MPIIGNGDVKTPADAHRMLETTGCDFVMVGRAALGNPWIFRELLGGPKPTPEERGALVLTHFAAHVEFVGEPSAAVRAFRRHLSWYAHGLRGASSFRAAVMQLETVADVQRACESFFVSAESDGSAGEMEDVDYKAALG